MSQNTRGDGSAPRHARHAATGAGGSRAPRRATGVRSGTHFAGATTSRYQNYERTTAYDFDGMSEQEAPRPVLDPAATGSFTRLDVGAGATIETRSNVSQISPDSTASWSRQGHGAENRLRGKNRPQVKSRSTKVKGDGKLFAIIAIAAALVVAVGLFVANGILKPGGQKETGGQSEQAQVDAGQTITYRNISYKLERQASGKFALVGYASGASNGTPYFEFEGTPVQLVLYNGALFIPENLDGSWDILGYTMAAGSLPTQVVNASGEAITGQGQIASVSLTGSNLVVTDSAGATTTVALG